MFPICHSSHITHHTSHITHHASICSVRDEECSSLASKTEKMTRISSVFGIRSTECLSLILRTSTTECQLPFVLFFAHFIFDRYRYGIQVQVRRAPGVAGNTDFSNTVPATPKNSGVQFSTGISREYWNTKYPMYAYKSIHHNPGNTTCNKYFTCNKFF